MPPSLSEVLLAALAAAAVVVSPTSGYNILILHPFYSGSHGLALRAVGEYLVEEGGHTVTQVKFRQANEKFKDTTTTIEVIDLPIRHEPGECAHYINSDGAFDLGPLAGRWMWDWGHTLLAQPIDGFCLTRAHCKTLLEEDEGKQLYTYLNDSKFDVALLDLAGNECGLAIARSLNLPVASFFGFSFGGLESTYSSVFNTPSYVPAFFSGSKQRMNFVERVRNFLWAAAHWTWAGLQVFNVQPYISRRFPELPPLQKLLHDVDLHLVNTNFLVDSTRLVPPNVKYVGGATLRNGRPLPDNLRQFVDSAQNGVVLFSLGFTVFEPKDIPKHVVRSFVRAFGRLKQKVIMRFDEVYIGKKPNNVLVSKWVPQQDILAHNNTVAFVSHMGMFSLLESVYHRVPIVAVPIFSDQAENARRVEEKEIGVALWDKFAIDEHAVYNALKTVIDDSKYKANVNRYADIWRDQPLTPAEETRYWIELLAKHRHLDHLRIPDDHLYLFQYLCIDVVAFLALSTLVLIIACFRAVLALVGAVRGSWNTTTTAVMVEKKNS